MFRQQSQASQRQKLSLKNILNMELEHQYKTNTFQSRPKTMYAQRQMKMFQEERIKLMTDHKLKRSNSNQVTRVKMASVDQGEQKVQNYRLKHALGRINVLADGSIQMNEQQKVSAIDKFLECLSRTQNYYKKAFSYIYQSFNHFVYCHIEENPIQCLQYVATKTKSETLIRLYNGAKHISYKELSMELFNEMNKKLQEFDAERIKTSKEFEDLEYRLEQKTSMITKLTRQVQFNEEHPSKDQYIYITQLQKKILKLQNELKRNNNYIKELQDSKEYLEQYNAMLIERVEDLRVKLYEFEMEQFSNLNQIEKNSDLKQFQDNAWVLKDLIQKGALRMASMRGQYNKIEAYNQQLLGQRSVLAKRAAVGFAQLTPRPNYKKIFEENGLHLDKIIPVSFKPTTEELVISLIKRFKQFYETYVKSDLKLQIPQRQKFMMKSNPGSPLMNELKKMSKQLKKTERLADQVKTGYNKQKEQKELLQKKNKK